MTTQKVLENQCNTFSQVNNIDPTLNIYPALRGVYQHWQRSEKVVFVWKYREPGKQDNVNRINANML